MKQKKNEFVFTIGFKRKDPEHIRVVKLLNETDAKNQLIVDAILCYVDSGYINVRPWNLQPAFIPAEPPRGLIQKHSIEPVNREEIDQEDVSGIMQSLDAFRRG